MSAGPASSHRVPPPAGDSESPRVLSVRHLQTLYTVVVGVALTVALEDVSSANGGRPPITNLNTVLLLIAFVCTLIPFYHGALRHLDTTYVIDGGKPTRSWALLADFVVLFLEGCVLLWMARQLGAPASYAAGFAALLVVDIGWGIAVRFELREAGAGVAEWTWVQNNFLALAALAAVVLPLHLTLGSRGARAVSVAVVLFSVLRTIVDYRRGWHFYFPKE